MEQQFDYIKDDKDYNKISESKLILIDDDYNTFDHVVDCLVSM